MKAEKLYLLPKKIAGNAKTARLFRMLSMAGMLMLSAPAMAQQYYGVTALSGTTAVGGRNVTVTSVNGLTATNCGVGPYREGSGTPGSYTWTFSAPVYAARIHVASLDVTDIVSISVNGTAYPLSAGQVNALPFPCTGNVAVVSGGVLTAGSGMSSEATIDIAGVPGDISDITVNSINNSGGVVTDFNFEPVQNFVPVFTSGAMVAHSICQDAAALDISADNNITDNDLAQNDTFTLASAPAHGTVTGYPYVAASTGGPMTIPANTFMYQPNGGFSGADSFIVRVNDGTDTSIIMFHITVNPTPDVTVSSSQTKCNNANTDSVYFLGSVAGTTFDWINDNTTTGLSALGTGDIASFIATNTFNAPSISTVTVTPTAAGCVGAQKLFTITVNPTPDVVVPAAQFACNGTTVAPATFTSGVSGTTYTWTNDNTSVGLAASGTGDNIPSFTGTNTGVADSMANISVVPTANSCVGDTMVYSVTIHPTPMLSTTLVPANTCDSTEFLYVPASLTTGTTYMWERAVVAGIANGIGNGTDTIRETLDNTTTGLVTVAYVYTLTTTDGCTNIQTVTDTVAPTLMLTSSLNGGTICNNGTFSYIPTSSVPGSTFQWDRTAVAGISTPATSNTFNPNEMLTNTTDTPIVVTYTYHTIYSNCTSAPENVTVTVFPTPVLNTALTPAAVCNNTMFTYGSGSNTPGTTFTWSRDSIAGISNTANSGADTIHEVLVNTTTAGIYVVYNDTLSANGCQNVQQVTVYVNPSPVLSSATTPAPVCSGASFDYIPASATAGTTFSWSRAAVAGVTNPAASGTGDIHETLVNPNTYTVTVTYIDTITVNGCTNTDSIHLVVNPIPKLSSVHTAPAVCNNTTFNYLPLSATTGATFNWSRAYKVGIDMLAATGSDNPNEVVKNSTNFNQDVVYVYTVTANGCSYNNDTVTVTVRPTPVLSSDTTAVTCSNTLFTYAPESYTPGTTFTWTRAHVAGILPATGAGSGNVSETLVDTAVATLTINTTYKFILNTNGCLDSQNVVVTVNPAPYSPSIAIKSANAVCSNTQFQNFGAAVAPAAGSTYIWKTINATVAAVSNSTQNALVTFPTAGNAEVILTSSIGNTGCRTADTFAVTVSSSVSDNPNVIYYNGQFMCLQNEVDTYQWGYDDALTLDSTLVNGEVNQTFFNSAPDLTYKYYWVMTTHNGCMQKAYYNLPATGVVDVNADAASVKVYPNPATANVNVVINTANTGDVQVEVLNMMGQKVGAVKAVDHKATINVANLPSGYYLVDCYREGVKIATAKFIKN